MIAPELKPCPWCGGSAYLVEGEESAYVQCEDMKIHRALWLDGDNAVANEVAEQWNRRADLHDATKAQLDKSWQTCLAATNRGMIAERKLAKAVEALREWDAMTNDNELIRRGDVMRLLTETGVIGGIAGDPLTDMIAAIPAVAASQPANLETCGRCMGSGYGGHPDSGAVCTDCNGDGAVADSQTADPVVKADSCQRIDVEEIFMSAVWGALKADANDLHKQRRILEAFRCAIDTQSGPCATAREALMVENIEVVSDACRAFKLSEPLFLAAYHSERRDGVGQTPDHRDAVIAQLVEAGEEIKRLRSFDNDAKDASWQIHWSGALDDLIAAIAAVKGVKLAD